ncbi:MAG: hypothetical protein ACK58L_06900 [Planctomycetota bacterium]
MRRLFLFFIATTLCSSVTVHAQVGVPGIHYTDTVAGGDGIQLYPYDQQDPWLHGYFQRYPAYGGFSSFRPYNYRHVFAQTQLAGTWQLPHGMPYSQQFWNKYRGSYLDQNLHSEATPSTAPAAESFVNDYATPHFAIPGSHHDSSGAQPLMNGSTPIYPAASVRPIGYQQSSNDPSSEHSVSERLDSIGRPVRTTSVRR